MQMSQTVLQHSGILHALLKSLVSIADHASYYVQSNLTFYLTSLNHTITQKLK